MKALIYADLQATDGHERCFNDPNTPLQLWRVRRFYAELKRIFDAKKCTCLWDLGDTTDDRSYLPMPAIDAVLEGLEPFPDHELNIKLIGNHEQYLRDTTKHIGRMFSRKFDVVATTEAFEIAGSPGKPDVLVACAAYPATDAALNDWLSQTAYAYRNYQHRILLGHFQVVGCAMSSGLATSGIDKATLHRYSLSLLGHVHKPQMIGSDKTSPIHYVGSPFQQNFGEKGEQKRVGVLDLETLTLTWVPMQGFPEYRVVTFAEWEKLIKKEEEHRYQVLLRDPKQAEAFYAHPLMGYAEPIYNYELESTAKTEVLARQSWTTADVMQRWLDRTPPGSRGIQLPPEDVLEFGQVIAQM